jgi:NAD(P)-dependent dehydrogenase (short-subunit alcohol dehydrogenase family)
MAAMSTQDPLSQFSVAGMTAAITGGGGIICSGIAEYLSAAGMSVAVLDLAKDAAEKVVATIREVGGKAVAVCEECERELGRVDCLINGAGGNHPAATTGPDKKFFDLPIDAFRKVMDLNIIGTVLPSMIFGRAMAARGEGVILNIASMNAFKPLTRIPAYSAAKAGVKNFTEWLAVHVAQEYSPRIRVNGIAPGFLLTNQNRFLLTDEKTGDLTPRGRSIITHTPMNRFGNPDDLYGTVLWLVSPASKFITGITVPVDGGYSAFGGV